MPTLPQQAQEAAEQADSRAPLPEDTYVLRLRDVDGTKSGPSGAYWSWEFEVAHNRDPSLNGRRLWNSTSLSKKAAWKVKEAFDAFDVPTSTDTDDLCGEMCLGIVVQEVIESGKRAGEMGNTITKLMPLPPDYELFDDDSDESNDTYDGPPASATGDEQEPF